MDRTATLLNHPEAPLTVWEWLMGGVPAPAVPGSAKEQQRLRDFAELVRRTAWAVDAIPRVPKVVPRLLHLLQRDDYQRSDVAACFGTDPVLRAKLLQLGSSATHARAARQAQSLEEAVDAAMASLGTRGLQKMVLQATARPVLTSQSSQGLVAQAYAPNWDLSLAQAELVGQRAQSLELSWVDGYLAGLVHGVARQVVLRTWERMGEPLLWPVSAKGQRVLSKAAQKIGIAVARQMDMPLQVAAQIGQALQPSSDTPMSAGQAVGCTFLWSEVHALQGVMGAKQANHAV